MFVSLCEMGAQPKGVIIDSCSALHCSNLLEVSYMTGHIHTQRDAYLTHISLLAEEKKQNPQFISQVFGEELGVKGNLCAQLGTG